MSGKRRTPAARRRLMLRTFVLALRFCKIAPPAAHFWPALLRRGQAMSGTAIKTIAVHLPTAGVVDRLLDAAAPLAAAHGATLIGVHVIPAVIVYADATVSMSTEFIVAQQEAFQEDAKAVEAAFRARAERAGVAYEWSTTSTPATSRRCAPPRRSQRRRPRRRRAIPGRDPGRLRLHARTSWCSAPAGRC